MDKTVNLWINYENYKVGQDWIKRKQKEWERLAFYGYRGPEDGFHKWLDTKQQEQQGSNKQRSLPLKDGGKILAGNGNSALLSITKGSNLLQDKAMSIPCG